MFSLFNFAFVFPGGQLTPFAPMCGRTWKDGRTVVQTGRCVVKAVAGSSSCYSLLGYIIFTRVTLCAMTACAGLCYGHVSVCLSVCLSVRHKPIMLSLLQRNGKMIQLDIWHIRLHPPQGQTGGSVAEWLACVLDSGAEQPGFKSQPRRCRVTVLGKLFTPILPLFTKQQNW